MIETFDDRHCITTEEPEAVLVSLDSVQPAPVAWLWDPWIPFGTQTLLDGDPGLGKSTLALDLAARLTRGWAMPPEGGPAGDPAGDPAGVLLLSAEDDLARTIRPRLDAAGADLARVFALEAVRVAGEEHPPVLPWDLALVEKHIWDHAIRFVIVDPLMAYLGDIDAHKDQDVRRCLHRLKVLAQKTGVAILLIRHLNKMGHSVALYRGGGSIGIVGAVRSALVVGRDPEDERWRVLAPVKCNLGPMPRALTYCLEPVDQVARIGWGAETELTANDILAHPTDGALAKAAAFLKKLLGGGAMPAAKVAEAAAVAGVSDKTLKRAKKTLRVKAAKSDFGGGWIWQLPGEGGQEGGQTQALAPFAKNGQKSTVLAEGGQEGQHGLLGPLRDGAEVVEWMG
jgi:hypothetical protein